MCGFWKTAWFVQNCLFQKCNTPFTNETSWNYCTKVYMWVMNGESIAGLSISACLEVLDMDENQIHETTMKLSHGTQSRSKQPQTSHIFMTSLMVFWDSLNLAYIWQNLLSSGKCPCCPVTPPSSAQGGRWDKLLLLLPIRWASLFPPVLGSKAALFWNIWLIMHKCP